MIFRSSLCVKEIICVGAAIVTCLFDQYVGSHGDNEPSTYSPTLMCPAGLD